MSTVTVSIGRNVGSEPLNAIEWADFKAGVRNSVLDASAAIFVDSAWSRGTWEGVEEDTCTWVAEAKSPEHVDALVIQLARWARAYRQDAIAITTGTTVLVGLAAVAA